MKLLSVAVILAALGPPDWLPPAPDVLLTQVDANGKELSDSFPAVCGLGVCRGALPVIFTDGSCLVSTWVHLPEYRREPGQMLFAAAQCDGGPRLVPGAAIGRDEFHLDQRGAATLMTKVGPDADPWSDLIARGEQIAYIRVDIIASTHAHR